MPRPKNLSKILKTLTPAQIEELRTLIKEDPRIAKLEQRLAVLDEKRDSLIAEIEALKGGKVVGKRRGRPAGTGKGKPGRPKAAFTSSEAPVKKQRGRPPMNKSIEAVAAPKKRGRKARVGVSTPEMKAIASKAVKKKERTPEEQSKIDARMAKARAARMQKSDS